MMSNEKNSAGPTSAEAVAINSSRSVPCGSSPSCACRNASSRLCAFSIMTTAASTMAPCDRDAAGDMMLAFTLLMHDYEGRENSERQRDHRDRAGRRWKERSTDQCYDEIPR
jgi:hypothetical protein